MQNFVNAVYVTIKFRHAHGKRVTVDGFGMECLSKFQYSFYNVIHKLLFENCWRNVLQTKHLYFWNVNCALPYKVFPVTKCMANRMKGHNIFLDTVFHSCGHPWKWTVYLFGCKVRIAIVYFTDYQKHKMAMNTIDLMICYAHDHVMLLIRNGFDCMCVKAMKCVIFTLLFLSNENCSHSQRKKNARK